MEEGGKWLTYLSSRTWYTYGSMPLSLCFASKANNITSTALSSICRLMYPFTIFSYLQNHISEDARSGREGRQR